MEQGKTKLKVGDVRKSILTPSDENTEDTQKQEEFKDIEEYENSLQEEEINGKENLPLSLTKDSVIDYVDEKVGKSETDIKYTAYTKEELITFAKSMAGEFYANYIIKHHPSQVKSSPQIREGVVDEIVEFSKVFLTKVSEL